MARNDIMPALTTIIESNFQFFIPDNLQDLINALRAFFESPEPGVVISPPLNGMLQRIDQLIQDYQPQFSGRLVAVDLGAGCEDVSLILSNLKQRGYNTNIEKLYICIRNADYCIKNRSPAIFSELTSLQRESQNLRIIFFFEINILSKANVELLHNTNLYSQIYYYPVLDDLDSKRFLKYLIGNWKMTKVSRKILGQIAKMYHGHMWLLKHALREYRKTPKIDISSLDQNPGTVFRLEQISKSFTEQEISTLLGQKNTNQESMIHLTKLKLLNNGKCSIPALRCYLKENRANKKILSLIDGDIYCNGINLKHSFTDQENQLLKKLISLKGEILSKEDIATIIWHQDAEAKYSVWAIEQLASRLRRKLQDIGVGAEYIKTSRNLGYSIDNF